MARWQEPMALEDLDSRRASVNAKRHDEPGIAASLGRFGFIEALVLDERTGTLLGGHGRLDQLIERNDAGEVPPEGVEVGDSGEWLVPVQRGWASADDAEASAAAVALNRLVERGGWDERALLDQLAPFRENGGLTGTGYGADDLDVILRRLQASGGEEIDPWAEWTAMPEFESASIHSAATVTVHFPTEEDAAAFFALIQRDRCRSLWWPQSDGHVGSNVRQQHVAEP